MYKIFGNGIFYEKIFYFFLKEFKRVFQTNQKNKQTNIPENTAMILDDNSNSSLESSSIKYSKPNSEIQIISDQNIYAESDSCVRNQGLETREQHVGNKQQESLGKDDSEVISQIEQNYDFGLLKDLNLNILTYKRSEAHNFNNKAMSPLNLVFIREPRPLQNNHENYDCLKKKMHPKINIELYTFITTNYKQSILYNSCFPVTNPIKIPKKLILRHPNYNPDTDNDNNNTEIFECNYLNYIETMTAKLWLAKYIIFSIYETPAFYRYTTKSNNHIDQVSVRCDVYSCPVTYVLHLDYKTDTCRLYTKQRKPIHNHFTAQFEDIIKLNKKHNDES